MPVSGQTGARPAAIAAAVLAMAMAASCVSYPATSADDYVGPVRWPAPKAPAAAAAPAPRPETPPAAPTAGPPPPADAPAPAPEPVRVTVTGAILMAVEHNQSLAVERLNPEILRTFEAQQRAVFDPDLTARYTYQRNRTRGLAGGTDLAQADSARVGLQQFLPTGTQVDVAASTDVDGGLFSGKDFFTSRVGLTVTQALLRGFGLDVNLASLRQARVDTLSSQYELRGFAESLNLAEQQLAETLERIRVGKLADIERAAAEAEVALRRDELITARGALVEARLRLLRLLNPAEPDFWARDVVAETPPVVPDVDLEAPANHVALALRMRPDLNQARLAVQRDDLELVRTRNGLLPRMDLFMTLGRTGYADSFGGSWRDLDKGYDFLAGVDVQYPPLNRDAGAQHRRAQLGRQQALESVANLAQLVEVDVRTAHVRYSTTRQRVTATAATRRFQEEKMRAETEKFRAGKSTPLLVAQAQRDLLASQIAEVEAVIANLETLVEFYRLEGTLLERRGLEAPGREPVELRSADVPLP